MKLKRIAASVSLALALGVAGTAAHAANAVITQTGSFDFGVLNQSMGVSVGDPDLGFSGAYDNVFTFTQASYSGASTLFAGLDIYGTMTAQVMLGVVSGSGAMATTTWGAWTGSATVPISSDESGAFAFSSSLGTLTGGTTYQIRIAGTTVGTYLDGVTPTATLGQASYTLTLAPLGAVPAVPEPESFAMLLAGLGLMGAVARRRRNHVASA